MIIKCIIYKYNTTHQKYNCHPILGRNPQFRNLCSRVFVSFCELLAFFVLMFESALKSCSHTTRFFNFSVMEICVTRHSEPTSPFGDTSPRLRTTALITGIYSSKNYYDVIQICMMSIYIYNILEYQWIVIISYYY